MHLGSLSLLDLAVVAAYLGAVLYIGHRAKSGTGSEEGFFLAGRKLGKLYQFFLTFGNATEPQGAVSTASLVYQRGVTGVWFAFTTVFMNPYFWFMNMWFRRVRLVTSADLFEDRLGSRGLARLYALFQVGVACVLLGFGNFVAYKIAASLVVKTEAEWTATERASHDGFVELKQLERASSATPATLTAEQHQSLATLRDRHARGELHNQVTLLRSLPFYLVFALVVGAYIVLGGMAAAAVNEALQGILIIVFSVLLLPTGISAIGGWSQLAHKVPHAMFDLFGGDGGSPLAIFAVLFTSLVQIHGLSHNMGIYGSAKDEFAARFGGVTGAYMKRIMIVLWAFTGLVAIAVFGLGNLSDPDAVWGDMSRRLLGPGFIGLMLAGVLAGTMSVLAAKALAVASLFVRNVWRPLFPATTEKQGVGIARWTIVAVLALGVLSAELMHDVESIVKLVITINVPFGAAVIFIFFWRRLTAPAVWCTVLLSILVIQVIPLTADSFPALARAPSLVQTMPDAAGKPVAVYFKTVVRTDPADPASALKGRGRFFFEGWLLAHCGLDVAQLSPRGRETVQFLFDGFFPFGVLLLVSLVTRRADRALVDQFYGKMKTPVGATPELEAAAMAATRANPARFDHTKLFPGSAWEFCKWDRVDTLGFLSCCAVSGAIIGLFVLLLRLAS